MTSVDNYNILDAVYDRNYNAVKSLTNRGDDCNGIIVCLEDSKIKSHTALSLASHNGDLNIVKLLIEHGADPNYDYGEVVADPLCEAIVQHHDDIVNYLLECGIPFNLSKALIRAVYNNRIEITKSLLSHGANPNVKNSIEWTPLHLAAGYGFVEIAKLLLSYNANPYIKGRRGYTPSKLARKKNNIKIVNIIEDSMFKTNIPDPLTSDYIDAFYNN